MFSMPEAAERLPSRRNHGLNPSDDFDSIIRRCYGYNRVIEKR